MAKPQKDCAQKRLRGPNIATVISAAAAAGQRLVGAVSKPGGVVELQFGDGANNHAPGNTPEDLKSLL